MALWLWPKKPTETIYLAILLIFFIYVLYTSPFGQHVHSDAQSTRHGSVEGDENRPSQAQSYINAIMDPKDTHFDRLQCPRPFKNRYKALTSNTPEEAPEKRYYFALNLHQCAYVLPRLLGSLVEVMRFLGPEHCVVSIVGGRSNDGTTQILTELRKEIEAMNTTYYFATSTIDPYGKGRDRVTEMSKLRNMATAPLRAGREKWSSDATVVFVNDVSICADDILELIYQKQYQQADMVCAVDWSNDGDTFYDSWISRSMNGDMFVEVPQNGAFDFADNLFWNDDYAKYHVQEKLPLQVFACWNGAVAFKAEPLLQHNLKFRASYRAECYAGEPTLFCKDMWYHGYGRIAIIPSVNLGYSDDQSREVKKKHGYASQNIQRTEHDMELPTKLDWWKEPPQLVKCQPDWTHSSWAVWNDKLDEHLPYDWTRSGFFNAGGPFDSELEYEGQVEEESEEEDGRPGVDNAEKQEPNFDFTGEDGYTVIGSEASVPGIDGHGIEGGFHGDSGSDGYSDDIGDDDVNVVIDYRP